MRPTTLALAAVALLAGCNSRSEPSDETSFPAAADSFAPLSKISSSSIDLPADEETFGEDENGALLNRACLACHSASMIRTQPPLTQEQWTATVTKMREAYGAPFEKSETGAIVHALMATAPSKD